MLNPYDFYITPEEYKIAAQNGIHRKTLEDRIRKLGWNKERAINTPTQKRTDYSEWYPIARENGIPEVTFRSRVNKYKWSEEKAATEPIIAVQIRNRKYSDEVYRVLEINGISERTFYNRISQGWSIERAMTEKKYTKEERVKKVKEALKNVNTGFKEAHKSYWALRNKNTINI